MFSKVVLYCLLIGIVTISINARIIPLGNQPNELLTIDDISTNHIPIIPAVSTVNEVNPVPIAPKLFHKSVCYPVLGCYENKEPFNNAALEVPQSPEHIDTHFLLFTQATPTTPEFVSYNDNDQSIKDSGVNASRWLRIIVHGFSNDRNSIWIKPLQDELLKLKDNELSDVLVVDWGKGAKLPFYPNAASNTRLVGKQIGLLLQKLHNVKGLSYDKVHCIGHSLGAHTCGIASNAIDNQIARISGLDPAGPMFEGKNTIVRLDKNDAKFVDVIHSNTEIALGVGLGSSDPSGHVDFYVNGARYQPGCASVNAVISDIIGGHSEAAFTESSCSHSRSHDYFIESINSECSFNAFSCQDYESFVNGKCLDCSISGCAKMGFYSIYSLGRGNMYLTTKSTSPFCGHQYLIELVLDQAMTSTKGEIIVSIHANTEILTSVSMTAKADVSIQPGDVFRHVFSFNANFGAVDYAIVQFNKEKTFLGLGTGKGNEIKVSSLRVKSMEDNIVYNSPCKTSTEIPTHTSQTMLLSRLDCHDLKAK